jgi:hypothetical protein
MHQRMTRSNPIARLAAATLRRTALLAAGLLVQSASAGPISETLNFTLNSDSSAVALNFSDFNPSLGTLDLIEVTYSAVRRHDWAFWNTSGASPARDVLYAASLAGTTVSLGGTAFAFADAVYGPTTAVAVPYTPLLSALAQFQAGRTQFLAGGTPDYPSAFHPLASLTNLGGSLVLPTFDGELVFSYDPGVLNVAYFDGVWTLDAQNVLAGSLVDVTVSATLTYHYTPVAVADSLPVWMFGVSLAGLCLGRRRLSRSR